MNSRERFSNTLQGKSIDRHLFGAVLSLYGAKLTGCPMEKYYNDPSEYVKGQTAVREMIDPDFLTTPFMLAGYGEAFGSELKYLEAYVPNILRPAIDSSDEISNLAVPNMDSNHRLSYLRESLRLLHSEHGQDKIITAIALNPIDIPIMIMGFEGWLKTVLGDKSGTQKMLEITVPFFVEFCNTLLKDGADIIAMPSAFLTQTVTTRRIVNEFALPVLRDAFKSINGPLVMHHTGSSFIDYIDLMAELPNVAGFAIDYKDNIRTARDAVHEEQFLLGGFDGPTLHTRSVSWVESRCSSLLSKLGSDRYFVPFVTGTDVSLDTPVENLIAIRKTIEEFGEAKCA